MSDAKLRELERRWKETGALADEAAYLRALVARGELSPTRLNLAAWVGAPAARAAAGLPAGPGSDARGLRALADGVSRVLGALRHEEMVAFAAACVRPHLAALEPLVPGTAAFLHAVDVWLACPCDDHRPVAVAGALVDPRPPVGAGLVAAARLLHVVELLECRRLVVTDDRAEQEAVFGRFLEDCVHDGLRESMARDVTAWALGRARPAPRPGRRRCVGAGRGSTGPQRSTCGSSPNRGRHEGAC